MTRPGVVSYRMPLTIWLLFGAILFFFLVGGAFFYYSQEQRIREDESQKLASIAELKAEEIARWRQERLGDATVALSGPFFSSAVKQWLIAPDPALAAQITERLDSYRRGYRYASAFIADTEGHIRLSAGMAEEHVGPETAVYLETVLREGRPLLSELYRCSVHHAAHLDVIAPLMADTAAGRTAVAALILRIDPNEFLYPLIQSWPEQSISAETLLVRRDGDDALFLNELRHKKESALNLRIPLSRFDVPAVRAVRGEEGVSEGFDYRGVRVLSALKHIPDSSWYMVAKIDSAEAFSAWRFRAVVIIGGLCLAVYVIFSIMGIFWHIQRGKHYKELLELEKRERAGEEYFRATFEQSGVGVSQVAFDGRFMKVNPRFCEIVGYSSEELLQKSFPEITHPDDRVADKIYIQKILDGETAPSREKRYVRKDGVIVWGSVTVTVVRDATGKPSYFLPVVEDISLRKRAEEALKKNEALLRTLINTIPDLVWMKDLDGVFIACNRRFEKLFGTEANEILGKTDYDFVDKEMADFFRRNDKAAMAAGKPTMNEEQVTFASDGHQEMLETIKTPIVASDGRIWGVLGLGHDITERKRAEETLKASEEKLRLLVKNLHAGIVVHAPDTQITLANEQASVLLGLTIDQMMGKTVVDPAWHFIREDRSLLPLEEYPVNQVFFKRTPIRDLVIGINRPKTNDLVWVLANAFPEVEADGTLRQIVVTFVDITDRKRAEEALRLAHEDWENTFNTITDMVTVHDADFNIIRANKAAREIFGISSLEELGLGTKCFHCYHGTEKPPTACPSCDCLKTGEPALCEVFEPHLNKHLEIRAIPRMGDGRIVGLVHVVRDITDRKQAEAALQESASRFDQLAEQSRTVAWEVDSHGLYTYVSRMAEVVLGYTTDELVGRRHFYDLHPEEGREAFKTATFAVFARKELFQGLINPVQTKDGRFVWVSTNGIPLLNTDGSLRGYRGSDTDITDRKQAEEALRKSEREFRLLAEAMPQIVWITRPDGWNIYFNQQWVDYTGQTLEESYGHGWNKPFHPDDRQRAWDAWQNAIKNGADYSLECRLRRADGVYTWWLIRGVPIVDAQGTVLKWFGTCTNIHDFKRTQEALKAERDRAQNYLDIAGTVLVSIASDQTITLINKRGCELLGYAPEELIGKNWFDIAVPQHQRDQLKNAFSRIMLGNSIELEFYENFVVTRNGKERLVAWHNVLLRDQAGVVTGTLSSGEDITEKRFAEEHLRRNEARLRSLAEILQHQSGSTQEFLDYALSEAIRLTESKIGYIYFYDEEKKEFTLNSWSRGVMDQCAVMNPQTVYQLEKTGVWGEAVRQRKPIMLNDFQSPHPLKKGYPKGHVELKRYLTVPVFNMGQIVAVVAVANRESDYTETDTLQLILLMDAVWKVVEQRRAQEAREELMVSLQIKNEEMESILYAASHDLRSPLVNIQGFSSRIQRYLAELERIFNMKVPAHEMCETAAPIIRNNIPKALGYVTASTDKMDALVNGLLKLSRLGRATHTPETIDMNGLMRETLDALKFQTQEAQATVTTGDLPACWGDRREIGQAFSNLVDNAIKYRDPKRALTITISGTMMGDRVTYTVTDTGIGIKKGHQEQIWSLFSRLDPSGPITGEGIGLTMVKRIVQRNRGKIWVESEPGKGSIFYIVLPHDRTGLIKKETAPHT